jgi:hypothetical protein
MVGVKAKVAGGEKEGGERQPKKLGIKSQKSKGKNGQERKWQREAQKRPIKIVSGSPGDKIKEPCSFI